MHKPCSTFGLEVTHAVDAHRAGQHEISRQRVVFRVADRVLAHHLHDILLLIQYVVYVERERHDIPTLVDRCVENHFVDVAQVVTIASRIAAVGADGPRLRQMELYIARDVPVKHIRYAACGERVLRAAIGEVTLHTDVHILVGESESQVFRYAQVSGQRLLSQHEAVVLNHGFDSGSRLAALDIRNTLVVANRGACVELELFLQEWRVVHQVRPYVPRQRIGIDGLLVELSGLVVDGVVDQCIFGQRGLDTRHDA